VFEILLVTFNVFELKKFANGAHTIVDLLTGAPVALAAIVGVFPFVGHALGPVNALVYICPQPTFTIPPKTTTAKNLAKLF
jgi:hypothetical protein